MRENVANNVEKLREKLKKEHVYHVNFGFFDILEFFRLFCSHFFQKIRFELGEECCSFALFFALFAVAE